MKVFLSLATLACLIVDGLGATLIDIDIEQHRSLFEQFKNRYQKDYESEQEEAMRFEIFAENVEKINKFNEEKADRIGHELGLNHLADLMPEEYEAMNGLRVPRKMLKNTASAQVYYESVLAKNDSVPDELDWRQVQGRVSEVKNQGRCGSCWAFSTTGLLEGQEVGHKDASSSSKPSLTALSEQDLVDCSKQNDGCNGGFMQAALQDIAKLGGIESENDYPYLARREKCRFVKSKSVFDDKDGYILEKGNEDKLKEIVAKYGPVAVAIDASSFDFHFYRRGVYFNKHCKNKEGELDHGVLVVGYGTDPKQGDYWIVKNSWSASWGDNGYIKMARNKENYKNHCGIATIATIATF